MTDVPAPNDDRAPRRVPAVRSRGHAGVAPVRRARRALYVAIALDVVGVFLLARADGFDRPLFLAAGVLVFVLELRAFAIALMGIATSIAYALYGLGTAVVALISIGVLGEPAGPVKLAALAAVISGVVILDSAAAQR